MRPQIIHNPSELATLLDANAPEGLILREETENEYAFDPAKWLNTPGNLALRMGFDLAMFDFVREGVFGGHIWFNSRGAQAFETARAMLEWMFTRGGAKTIIGETVETQRAAWLFVRKLGFKHVGSAERPMGHVLLSALHKDRLACRKSGEASPVVERTVPAR